MQNWRVIKKLSNGMLWSQAGATQNRSTVRVTEIHGANAGATVQNKEPRKFVKKFVKVGQLPKTPVLGPPCWTEFNGVVPRFYSALFSHLHCLVENRRDPAKCRRDILPCFPGIISPKAAHTPLLFLLCVPRWLDSRSPTQWRTRADVGILLCDSSAHEDFPFLLFQ